MNGVYEAVNQWYEHSFGKDYMTVYKHRDWTAAAREVQQMVSWLALEQGARILDIGCGMGRHAIALSELGYEVTGLDLSRELLSVAEHYNVNQQVNFVHGDMRKLPFADGQFAATCNLFTSFGYFADEADNVQVLQEIYRVLDKRQGKFLIDFMNATYVQQHLVPKSERLVDGIPIVERRTIIGDWVVKEIRVGDRDYEERVHMFSLAWFEHICIQIGLKIDCVYGAYEGYPYDPSQSPRLIMVGSVK